MGHTPDLDEIVIADTNNYVIRNNAKILDENFYEMLVKLPKKVHAKYIDGEFPTEELKVKKNGSKNIIVKYLSGEFEVPKINIDLYCDKKFCDILEIDFDFDLSGKVITYFKKMLDRGNTSDPPEFENVEEYISLIKLVNYLGINI